MTKLNDAITHLKNDSGWALMNDMPLMTQAMEEIDNRLSNLEKFHADSEAKKAQKH